MVGLNDEDIILTEGFPDLADPLVRYAQTVGIGRDILTMAAKVGLLYIGADEGGLLLLHDLQSTFQHTGGIHHRDAGSVVVGNNIRHLSQQEHRQAALAQNGWHLHLRVNAVAHVDAMPLAGALTPM